MRLIDADALMERFAEMQQVKPDESGREYACNFRSMGGEPSAEWYTIEDAVENAPTIDAVPVIHSEWVYNDGDYVPYCKNCLMPSDTETKYCASCGAKMNGETDERKEDY